MTGLNSLIRRNVKLYFKDKGMFLTSLITPVILLVLYVTFLGKIYESSFGEPLEHLGITLSDSLVNGCVGGQLVSSILAVSSVTVAFCSNLLSVQDKLSGARRDLNVSPVKPSVTALAYFAATVISSLIISFSSAAVCLVYLAFSGWFLTVGDVLLLLFDVVLLVLFGTSLSSCIIFPLSTQGQASAVGTAISAGYGFVCGAYMPISNFSVTLQRVLSFLPGTYGTSLIRNHALRGVFEEMRNIGFPEEVVKNIRDSIDCNFYFFGNKVEIGAMYGILIGAVVLFASAYVAINAISSNRTTRKTVKK